MNDKIAAQRNIRLARCLFDETRERAENGMENYDFDPLSSVTDLDEFELWSD
jgi:hypothetical protein